jgi:hypothetical protein
MTGTIGKEVVLLFQSGGARRHCRVLCDHDSGGCGSRENARRIGDDRKDAIRLRQGNRRSQ